MKSLLLLMPFLLAGCQSAPGPGPAARPQPEPSPVAVVPPAAPAHSALEQKIRQQAQFIEALLSQNDALTARLNAPAAGPEPVPAAALPPVPAPVGPEPAAPGASEWPTLAPNADGVIDVAAADVTARPGEPVNPFAVRALANESVREVSLRVGGIIAGPTACAVINDRLVQAGETIETLRVERIDSDAVFLRHGGHDLRLPVSEKTVRVRLPL